MRFGKRLAEILNTSDKHYVSYKELKRMVGEMVSGRHGHSEDSDAEAQAPTSDVPSAEERQQAFYSLLDTDIQLALEHVRRVLCAVEVSIGEWQSSAIVAGVLFTPEQLEEVAAALPFAVTDESMLVKWLLGLRPASDPTTQQKLISKYGHIESTLAEVMLYIEVNLTAVRKILKKLEKKIPADVRIRNANEYRAHYSLLSEPLQSVLVTTRHIKELLASCCDQNALATPGLVIGLECQQVLQALRGSLEDIVPGPALNIDVYAKPTADNASGDQRGARHEPTDPARVAVTSQVVAVAVAQQAASVVQSADFFQGPPSMQAQARADQPAQRPRQISDGRTAKRRGGRGGAGRGAAQGRRQPVQNRQAPLHQPHGDGRLQGWHGQGAFYYAPVPIMGMMSGPCAPDMSQMQGMDPRWLAAMAQMRMVPAGTVQGSA